MATQIWVFWPGMRPVGMPTFAEKFGGKRAALTTGEAPNLLNPEVRRR